MSTAPTAASTAPAPVRRLEEGVERLTAPVPAPVLRLRQAVVCLLLVVLAFAQSPGRVSPDTKLDLTERPGGWLLDALRVWSPDGLGSLQNQAYGYLFPMGPFHLLGLGAGLEPWVVQRLWWSVLLVAAFLGVVRLAARLGIGTPGFRVLAGLAYALSPRVLTELGALSSELMPMAALPWVLVPLVGPGALELPRRAAARSGVAVLCAGAVNAVATLAVLPLAALFLAGGLRHRPGRRLAGWWVLGTALACAWWIGPLLLQGAYSPPFLDYIETAATTTQTTSLVEVLRGTSQWLSYLVVDGRPWWRAGWTLVSSPVVVLDTAVVAGLGLAGLASRRMPHRAPLVLSALLGVLVMTAGHVGDLGSPFAGQVRDLLDGALAPFRNVHKADPLLRLPLVLGLCHLLTLVRVPAPRRLLAGVSAVALLGSATPALAGQLAPSGTWDEIPAYWDEAADWVEENAGTGSALVLPAAADAEHLWGRPLDDPLQVLADSPVVLRDAVPLGGPQLTRLLDAVGARLDTGRGSPGLARALSRTGVRFLVVRNDLDRGRTGAPRPALVAQALAASPGIELEETFGPDVGDASTEDGLVADRGLDAPRPAVEVYEVASGVAPVTSYPLEGALAVAGGPEALLQLADRGLLDDRGVVLAGEGEVAEGEAVEPVPVLTDGLRRREVDFGRVREAASVTLTAEEPLVRDQPAADLLPAGAAPPTTARWEGASSVTASSTAADPGGLLGRAAERAPAAALDGRPETAWFTGDVTGPVGEWLEVELDEPRVLSGTTLSLAGPELSTALGRVTEVEVATDAGQATTSLRDTARPQPLEVPAGQTRTLRVTVTGVERQLGDGPLAGFRELNLPGVEVRRTLVLPPAPVPGEPLVLLDAVGGGRSECLDAALAVRCSPELVREGEDLGRLDRTFVLDAPAQLPLDGRARPRPGAALEALLDQGASVRVTASSRAVQDPRGRPQVLVDADWRTGWVADRDDDDPVLELRWDAPRPVTGVWLQPGRVVASAPTRVRVSTLVGRELVDRRLPPNGYVPFAATELDGLRITVLEDTGLVSAAPGGQLTEVGVGLAEVRVLGPGPLTAVPPEDSPLDLPCGQGPTVEVDGEPVPTRATGTRQDLLRLRPLVVEACAPLDLSGGEHRVVAEPEPGDLLEVTSLTLGSLPPEPAELRGVDVRTWQDERRVVQVEPGPASWLAVRENANAGWSAELDGRPLEPARLDGWRQAWVLPAGAGGRVELVYGPGALQRGWLAGGAVGVVLLLGLAVRRGRPSAAPVRATPLRVPPLLGVLAGGALLTALGGPVGLAAWAAALVLHRLRPGLLLPMTGLAVVGAGAVVALAPWGRFGEPGALSPVAQVLGLLAVAALAASLLPARPSASAAAPAPRPAGG